MLVEWKSFEEQLRRVVGLFLDSRCSPADNTSFRESRLAPTVNVIDRTSMTAVTTDSPSRCGTPCYCRLIGIEWRSSGECLRAWEIRRIEIDSECKRDSGGWDIWGGIVYRNGV